MEIDWIRGSSRDLVEALLARYQLDLFIGSVHHVHEIPIDFDRALYERALQISNSDGLAGGASVAREEKLFADYFDCQFDMLKALRPPIIGHFDLIRLYSSDPDCLLQETAAWQRVLRNLQFVIDYGGLLEMNSSALRKGLREPYPQRAVVEVRPRVSAHWPRLTLQRFHGMGGKFVLSDDSHGVEQIGACYADLFTFATSCGLSTVAVFERSKTTFDSRFPGVSLRERPIDEVRDYLLAKH